MLLKINSGNMVKCQISCLDCYSMCCVFFWGGGVRSFHAMPQVIGPKLATWLACHRMGNGPRNKNGREIAGEMAAGPPAREGPKMAKIGRTTKIWQSIFQPVWNPPLSGAISPAISRPFLVLGPFPIL